MNDSRTKYLHDDSKDSARVLVVEDSKAQATSLGYALWNSGFDVEIALMPNRPLTKYERFAPDVVLLDYELPDCERPGIVQDNSGPGP